MPTTIPGEIGRSSCPAVECRRDFLVGEGEDGGGEQRSIDGAGAADGEGADRNARGHLNDGVEAILTAERLGLDRNSEHRDRSERRNHAGEVGGAAGAGDNDLVSGVAGAFRESNQPIGRAVCRDDQAFVGDAEGVESVGGFLQDHPVRLAAHDDGNRDAGRCFLLGHQILSPRPEGGGL
jgi:hypothetical protein